MGIDFVTLALAKKYADEKGGSGTGVSGNFVAYDKKQNLTDKQKSQARANIGAANSGDLTILPIDRVVDYGVDYEETITAASLYGGNVCRHIINLTPTMDGIDNYIFKVQIPDDCVAQHVMIGLKNPNGGTSGAILMQALRNAIFLWISIDTSSRVIAFYELLSNREWRITYDQNGGYVGKTSTTNITSDNLIAQFNSLSKASSYVPSADTDVATKGYIVEAISEQIATDNEVIELLMQEDMFPVVMDSDGSILADENENILLW